MKDSLIKSGRRLLDLISTPVSMVSLGLIAGICFLGLFLLADRDQSPSSDQQKVQPIDPAEIVGQISPDGDQPEATESDPNSQTGDLGQQPGSSQQTPKPAPALPGQSPDPVVTPIDRPHQSDSPTIPDNISGAKTITIGVVQFNVNNLSCTETAASRQECWLEYTYGNISNQTIEFPTPCSLPSWQKIIDQAGNIYRTGQTGACITMVLSLKPGESTSWQSRFELPLGQKPDRIRFVASADGQGVDLAIDDSGLE